MKYGTDFLVECKSARAAAGRGLRIRGQKHSEVRAEFLDLGQAPGTPPWRAGRSGGSAAWGARRQFLKSARTSE
eukprot:2483673-Pyramimonas_sp.AAC.1